MNKTADEMEDPACGPAAKMARVAYLLSEHPVISHTFIDREIRELERRGHHVEIAAIRKPDGLSVLGAEAEEWVSRTFYVLAELKRFPVAVVRLAQKGCNWKCMISTWFRAISRRPLRLASYAYFVEAVIVVDWMLERDIEHVHNHFGNAAGTVAAIAAASHLIKFSMSIHGPDIFYNVESDLLAEKLRWAHFVRCISWYSRSQLCLLTPPEQWGKFEIVRCGVETSLFAPREEPINPVPRVLCVGRLVPAKGQALLVEASARLRASGCAHQLVLVGTGPDEAFLREKIAKEGLDHVIMPGGMNQQGVRAEYRRADLFVLASFAEGVPVVLMEAMACGIPVISTRITGIPELIEDGVSGLLVPPGDADALASAIRRLIEDLELRKAVVAAGREKVVANYNLAESGPAMADLFERNLSRAA
jgi:colanic acid/amylovoran biosynthesis glycosyltransferase